MPGTVPPVADERQALLAYLAQQRYVLRLTAYGLTDQQAAEAASVSELTVGGLIKHVTKTERHWMDIILQQQSPFDPNGDWTEGFRMETSLADLLDDYDRAAQSTEEIISGIADLGQDVPVPRDTPWFPAHVEAWSVRWVLLHLISETARHAGHADIVRESIDGATAFPLMAAVEDWPASPWLEPWSLTV